MDSTSAAAEPSREEQQEQPQNGASLPTEAQLEAFLETFDQCSRVVDFFEVKIEAMVRNIDDIVNDYPVATMATASPLELFRFNTTVLKMLRDVNEVKKENESLRVEAYAMKDAINDVLGKLKAANTTAAESEAEKK